MKTGHPRVYNPWNSVEYNELSARSEELMEYINAAVWRANTLVLEQRIVHMQMRDCMLTRDEQIARLDALDEIGAPQ